MNVAEDVQEVHRQSLVPEITRQRQAGDQGAEHERGQDHFHGQCRQEAQQPERKEARQRLAALQTSGDQIAAERKEHGNGQGDQRPGPAGPDLVLVGKAVADDDADRQQDVQAVEAAGMAVRQRRSFLQCHRVPPWLPAKAEPVYHLSNSEPASL